MFLAGNFPFCVNGAVLQFIRESLQNNVAGVPVAHRIQTFTFDPDIPPRLRPQYFEACAFKYFFYSINKLR